MDNIIIKRDSKIIGKIPADERTVFQSEPNGQVTATFYHTSYIQIQIWDTVIFSDVNYYFNTHPEIRVSGFNDYIYILDLSTHPTNKRGAFTH
jgi:hypothetical protein